MNNVPTKGILHFLILSWFFCTLLYCDWSLSIANVCFTGFLLQNYTISAVQKSISQKSKDGDHYLSVYAQDLEQCLVHYGHSGNVSQMNSEYSGIVRSILGRDSLWEWGGYRGRECRLEIRRAITIRDNEGFAKVVMI